MPPPKHHINAHTETLRVSPLAVVAFLCDTGDVYECYYLTSSYWSMSWGRRFLSWLHPPSYKGFFAVSYTHLTLPTIYSV